MRGKLILLIIVSGCSIWTQAPLNFPTTTEYTITPEKRFEEIGEVEGESCVYHLFVISWGDGGYISAYKDALSKLKEANAIINIRADYKIFELFGLYGQFCTVIRGTAIKFREKGEKAEGEK